MDLASISDGVVKRVERAEQAASEPGKEGLDRLQAEYHDLQKGQPGVANQVLKLAVKDLRDDQALNGLEDQWLLKNIYHDQHTSFHVMDTSPRFSASELASFKSPSVLDEALKTSIADRFDKLNNSSFPSGFLHLFKTPAVSQQGVEEELKNFDEDKRQAHIVDLLDTRGPAGPLWQIIESQDKEHISMLGIRAATRDAEELHVSAHQKEALVELRAKWDNPTMKNMTDTPPDSPSNHVDFMTAGTIKKTTGFSLK